MRINKLQKIILMYRIIRATLFESMLIILGSIFCKQNRKFMDKRVHIWNKKLLDAVHGKFKVFDPYKVEFLKSRPYIIMSNHMSHYDIPLIYAAFPSESIRMIAKKELFRVPILGWGMKAGECVFVDRQNKYQAMKDVALAKQKMLSGIRMWIAPEGTRSRTGKMGEFKKGGFKIAIDTKAIIVPVAIIGSNKILPAKTFDLSTHEEVAMHICKPIDAANYERKDVLKLMHEVYTAINEVIENEQTKTN